MISNRTTSPRKSLGQGMTEYIIIVALIAVAAIGVYSFFGKTIRGQTATMANELTGKNSQASLDAAKEGANKAEEQAQKNKNLGDYNQQSGK